MTYVLVCALARREAKRAGRSRLSVILPLAFGLGLSGCGSVPLTTSGSLKSYDKLGPVEGKLSKSRVFLDEQTLLMARSIAISPTKLSPQARSKLHEPGSDRLVSNALDRALCIDLSDRFRVVRPGEPADLTVQAEITDIVPTGKLAAGVSKVTTLGTSAVLPVGIPRLPIGLGGLAVEAEALTPQGTQVAAIVWSRGANSITNGPRVSEVGDAYGLASAFAGQFSQMLQKGQKPSGINLSLPSGQKLKSGLGGAPKNAACEAFGRAPGIGGMVGTMVGAPPSWSDKAGKQ
ncbi:DUF3313 domain-containing protein [Agrobacterium vitis]|uniref:DUF3313 domain-containing protein n=1 Tax=Agrobacterium vitis TaxID=373 RepID=UPI0012E96236|nr:DUF3313 domain-containing protein [Agrobacterium vitis]MVA26359.1 DUF3313 family protein [Agrobacterium vitis]